MVQFQEGRRMWVNLRPQSKTPQVLPRFYLEVYLAVLAGKGGQCKGSKRNT